MQKLSNLTDKRLAFVALDAAGFDDEVVNIRKVDRTKDFKLIALHIDLEQGGARNAV